jgi:hypothetical protein
MDKCKGTDCLICVDKVKCNRCNIQLSRHTCIPRVYFDFSNTCDKSRLLVSYSCPTCGQLIQFSAK